MSPVKFVQSSGGLLLVFGGFLLIISGIGQLLLNTSLVWAFPWTVYALVVGMCLVTLGLFRLFNLLNPRLNLFGRIALLASLIGAAVASFGWALSLIAPDSFFGLLMAGWMLHLMGVSVFGGYAVTTHLLPRWNFALLIGSAFPLVILFAFPGFSTGGINWSSAAVLLLIGFGWALTGLALERKSDAAQTLTAQHG